MVGESRQEDEQPGDYFEDWNVPSIMRTSERSRIVGVRLLSGDDEEVVE